LGGKRIGIEDVGERHFGAGCCGSQLLPIGTIQGGMTGMPNIISIIAHTVYPANISLVFNGSRFQKGIPRIHSAIGPIGYVEQYIVVAPFGIHGVSGPLRKAQIVTD